MEDYLQYIGGTAGAITLSTIAAGAAYYFATRPLPDTPLVPLDNQSPILEVNTIEDLIFMTSSLKFVVE